MKLYFAPEILVFYDLCAVIRPLRNRPARVIHTRRRRRRWCFAGAIRETIVLRGRRLVGGEWVIFLFDEEIYRPLPIRPNNNVFYHRDITFKDNRMFVYT